ncbi:MAG: LysR substrate-binding domain-containing protein [Oceanospirillaceae bacterium]
MKKFDRRHLPLNALRAFEAAAQFCHLGRAAMQLGVTQGAVSQQVRSLEAQLGVELFLRKHKRLFLTAAGQSLLETISQSLDTLTQGIHQLDSDNQSMAGELIICSTPSITQSMLIHVMGRFNRAYPEVTLKLQQIPPNLAVLPVGFDVCVCFGSPQDTADMEKRRLINARFYPVASPALVLNKPGIELGAELIDYPLLHDRSRGWTTWFNQFASGQTQGQGPNIYYSDNYQALMAARLGQGVALAEYYEIVADLKSGQLVLLNSQGVETGIDSYLVLPTQVRQTLRSQVFVDFIDQHLKEQVSYVP